MTWNEFKAEVDKKLELVGADGSVEIQYIDVGSMFIAPSIRVVNLEMDNGKSGKAIRIID